MSGASIIYRIMPFPPLTLVCLKPYNLNINKLNYESFVIKRGWAWPFSKNNNDKLEKVKVDYV